MPFVEAVARLAVDFCRVHRDVGEFHQGLCIIAVGRIHADADRYVHDAAITMYIERLLEDVHNPLRSLLGKFGRIELLEH